MANSKLPVCCPSCAEALIVSQLSCPNCTTSVSGKYSLPVLMALPEEEQEFILQFFLSSGSLKQMASQMSISYPTVRNRLDDLITKITNLKSESKTDHQ